MAQQTINVGSSANSGGGDPLRNALIKVNENFTEVYAKLTALEDGSITTSITGDVKGSVYAEDSTLLVDAVNGNIPYSVLSGAPTIPTALSDLAGDYQGSVFADDSTLLVDGVNGKLVGPLLTNNIASPATGNLELDVGRENGGAFIVTAWEDRNDPGNGWKQILWGYDGSKYEFFVGGDIAAQGNITTNNVTANNLIAKQGQILYIMSTHTGGVTTNATFQFDNGISNVKNTFYNRTEFASNGADIVVNFNGATVENWTDPDVVNEHGGSAAITVGAQTASMDDLTVRIVDDTPGALDVEFNYDAGVTALVSANGDVANRFSGTTSFAAGNTTWTTMNVLNTVGDKGEFTIVDHSYHKIYRVTTFAKNLPAPGIAGDAYCVIERLK